MNQLFTGYNPACDITPTFTSSYAGCSVTAATVGATATPASVQCRADGDDYDETVTLTVAQENSNDVTATFEV